VINGGRYKWFLYFILEVEGWLIINILTFYLYYLRQRKQYYLVFKSKMWTKVYEDNQQGYKDCL